MRLLPILLLVSCGGKSAEQPASDACDLAGTYRLRFGAAGQWMWLRFRVEGQFPSWKGVSIPPRTFETPNHAVEISQDGERCSFTATHKTDRGPVFAQVNFDPKNEEVKGTLRRQDARDPTRPLHGVRDVGKQKSKEYCVKPGRYVLSIPNEQAWKPDNKNMSCDKARLALPFLVEYLGDELVIDQLDDDGTAAWAGEDILKKGPCEYWVRFRHYKSWVSADLTFAGDQVTASSKVASVVIEDQGGRWTCEAKDPVIWVEAKPN